MIRKFQSICTSVLFVAIEIPAGNCYSGKMKSMDFKPHNFETPQNTSMKHVILIFDSKQRLEAQSEFSETAIILVYPPGN